eukprot:9478418-Pyramimonas_sp.AAC.1
MARATPSRKLSCQPTPLTRSSKGTVAWATHGATDFGGCSNRATARYRRARHVQGEADEKSGRPTWHDTFPLLLGIWQRGEQG